MLRRPVKYNPDKRDFVLTSGNLSLLDKPQSIEARLGGNTNPNNPGLVQDNLSSADDIFETTSDISRTESQISYGNRVSKFGFTDMFGQSKRTQPESASAAASS